MATTSSSPVDRQSPPSWKRKLVSGRLLRHEVLVVGAALVAFAIIALVLATMLWGAELLVIALPVLFFYILLLGWPVWLAALEEDMESEAGRIEREQGNE